MNWNSLRHQWVTGLIVAVCLSLASCGSDRRLAVYPAKGTISLNGKPLPNATVIFHAEFPLEGPDGKPAPVPGGYSNSEGLFTVSTYGAGDGLPEGEYRVTVSCEDRTAKPVQESYPELLPIVYQDPTKSGLTASISGGQNELPTFELKR
ncbi:MAG: hypothetical protein JWN70_3133 [Planctomycetaceae bacterium]|nr:hypothetical protein [Planctomycetaceae bacterium]